MIKKNRIHFLFRVFQLAILSVLLIIAPLTQAAVEGPRDKAALKKRAALLKKLKKLNLKQLSTIQFFNPEATSASRTKRKLMDTASALFVISSEDIRRAGITSIPEALRLAPGVQVARVYSSRWAISARGLNGLMSSKLLVMIDGRTIYSGFNSTVYWDVQNTLIEDIDRIEVIRGPGASLWGANAVNGIINIITKKSKQTQGNLITTYLGTTEEQAVVGIQHGGKIGSHGHYRVYGKFSEHDSFVDSQGQDANDNWQMKRGGFRTDLDISKLDNVTIQGDIYDGFKKQTYLHPGKIPEVRNAHTYISGFNLLARWQRNLTNGDIIMQSYYDLTERQWTVFQNETRSIYDIDFQHRWQPNVKQEFIWGLGFRHLYDENKDEFMPITRTIPEKREDNLFSAFVQAEFTLLSNSPISSKKIAQSEEKLLRLTLGSKFEHNDYTGFEYQPTIRLLWTPNAQHSAWAAISRAVRVPSRMDQDNEFHGWFGKDLRFTLLGNHDFESEIMIAHELGYRFNLSNRFLFDANIFYNEYDRARTLFEQVDFQLSPPPPTVITTYGNNMTGEVYGLELLAQWQTTKNWRLVATYNYVDIHLHHLPISKDIGGEGEEGDTPHHQASLRSLLTLPNNWEFDTALYYVDNLPNQKSPNYTRFDVRLGWQPRKDLSLSLGARNMFDNQHPEYGIGASGNTDIPFETQRTFYLQANYRF
ncbi:TonB-dependent receptor [Candidatus Parabeggiatoa sp. HSG14]|uniref:TonB-dependent receptor plug domain-containing protein n=1 Tax=Candidatus Parabeggiatoa sp. HSG14 TaxID=3055593 RepID=UPI0025A70694|nr:TonB-dependent receptor [Thiotrichales bacterium HSG14]